jgi:pimeloyl-ACP methyl ester carboxylesterase
MRADLGDNNFVEYDTFGNPEDPCVLLVMGLSAQMLAWRESFCSMLAQKKFFVVRFDNRDSGLSRNWAQEHGSPPLIRRVLFNAVLGRWFKIDTPYTLKDMGNDAFSLLTYLKIDAAHLVGVSMGGMIAQTMALENPTRVLSLCSIMSTTGARNLPSGSLSVRLRLLKKPKSSSHEDRKVDMIDRLTLICLPATPSEDLPEYVDTVIRRGPYDPSATTRQLNAIIAQEDRTAALGSLPALMPCLVIHGTGDSLVPLACGEATARALGGTSRLYKIEGMGHTIVRKFYQGVVDAIVSNATRLPNEA